ncbi:hypothetical protein BKA67DRAFT_568032 [Truncatella angustata]|uniref:1-alkyl-2-acetylglycerophosphocholine esterase n=1 Tax=Truncatella angustata TaxID=152316 RepID=A0A9P8ZXF2_9PEZI|nr:uncharacterized protein BKA67DRAFT_568032 [Truncatella angustata]KAH6652939.1 hypothetical protein BKA67DRAFT_568032 [Truncatella angustata]
MAHIRLFLTFLHLAIVRALTLPTPTGPFSVALFTTALTDVARMDPYAPADTPQRRRAMISVFTPVDTTKYQCVNHSLPYMTTPVAKDYDLLATSGGLPDGTFTSLTMQLCNVTEYKTCSKSRKSQRGIPKVLRPLLLFSPGFGQSRLVYNAMAQSLASEGHIVVSIDHPYDASVVEFPDGSLVKAANISSDDIAALEALVQVRAADVSFVIDQLQSLPSLRKAVQSSGCDIDFARTVMYGHSLGGATAAAAMLSDPRIYGGANLDGRFFNPVEETGLTRPFINVGRPNHRKEDPTWDTFYQNTQGPMIEISVNGTLHGSFTDFPLIVSTLNITDITIIEGLQEFLGTTPWMRVGDIVKSLIMAFDDFVFNHTKSALLQGVDSKFPEVELVRGHF